MSVNAHAEDHRVNWIDMTPDEFEQLKQRSLAHLGMTYDQLAALHRSGDFMSWEARQVWAVFGAKNP